MNKKMLRRLIGTWCIPFPHVLSIFPDGRIVRRHWPWFVEDYRNGTLVLHGTTGHVLELPDDGVISEFARNVGKEPSFLVLKRQIWITALDAGMWPILNWRPEARPLAK